MAYHVFRGLSEIARRIYEGKIRFTTGDSIKLSWQIYQEAGAEHKNPGICQPLSIGWLGNPAMVGLLRRELSFLKNSNTRNGENPEYLESLGLLEFQKEIESLSCIENIDCFLVYGSLTKERQDNEPGDADIIIVADNLSSDLSSLFSLIQSKFRRLDVQVFETSEIESGTAFIGREFTLEYLSKGISLHGHNLFQEQSERVIELQYKESMLIRANDYVQRVRKLYYSRGDNPDQKIEFMNKYTTRLSRSILLMYGVATYEQLEAFTPEEIYGKMVNNGFLSRETEFVLDGRHQPGEVYNYFNFVARNLIGVYNQVIVLKQTQLAGQGGSSY